MAEIVTFSKIYPDRQLITSCSKSLDPNQPTPFILNPQDQVAANESDSACIVKHNKHRRSTNNDINKIKQ